jgi:hypothetical protein
MQITFKKDKRTGGGEYWFAYQGPEQTIKTLIGSYRWRWTADNSGAAFSRNRGNSSVYVIVRVGADEGATIIEFTAGKADSYNKAAKIARAYIRANKQQIIASLKAGAK